MRNLLTIPTNEPDRSDPAIHLGPRTTFKIGGSARRFYTPRTIEELSTLMSRLDGAGEKPFILGGGANVLFPDGEYERPVICTSALDEISVQGTTITAGPGVRLGTLIQKSLRVGLGGLEVLSGVCAFPNRIKCASLAWHTLTAPLHNSQGGHATTE